MYKNIMATKEQYEIGNKKPERKKKLNTTHNNNNDFSMGKTACDRNEKTCTYPQQKEKSTKKRTLRTIK